MARLGHAIHVFAAAARKTWMAGTWAGHDERGRRILLAALEYRRRPKKNSAMQYTKLGRTGLDVSRLCLGCMSYGGGNSGFHQWSLGEEESRPFIKKALEAGINFFDTANRYSVGRSEEVLGRALNDFARREEVVIATKVFNRMRPARMAPVCPAKTSCSRSMRACADSAPIMSTSIRSIASIMKLRSKRRWRRCTMS